VDNCELMEKYYNGEITAQEYIEGIIQQTKGETGISQDLLEQVARGIYIKGVFVGAGIMGLLWLILG